MESNITADYVLATQTKRSITLLFKGFLGLLEDLNQDYPIPPQKFTYLRKKVLDMGNESLRSFDEQIKTFDIKFGKRPN